MIRSMESFDIIQSKIRYSLASDEYIHMEDNDSIVKLHKVKKTNGTHESFLLCARNLTKTSGRPQFIISQRDCHFPFWLFKIYWDDQHDLCRSLFTSFPSCFIDRCTCVFPIGYVFAHQIVFTCSL